MKIIPKVKSIFNAQAKIFIIRNVISLVIFEGHLLFIWSPGSAMSANFY